ncbi:hypothetical protein FNV43_RR25355 [Rhamnella rubrinervis]|uniref:RNase H type-1 domain-containing protein n=1 Tax=Rhamnella rubrinervis TaxID=2594499 RepID=A0A8K0DN74_9ROSA|nr:hypothetical protein FNV43_RR25355 [Rhamnella rubrinervis]
MNCVPFFVAEVEALRWAVEYAEQCDWRKVEWETDAKEVEAAVNSKEDPIGWYAYYSICCIRNCFEIKHWEVRWRRRSNNLAADAASKLALSSDRAFIFDEFSLGLIPYCILDVLIAEQF